jgi:hypothetical protein
MIDCAGQQVLRRDSCAGPQELVRDSCAGPQVSVRDSYAGPQELIRDFSAGSQVPRRYSCVTPVKDFENSRSESRTTARQPALLICQEKFPHSSSVVDLWIVERLHFDADPGPASKLDLFYNVN